VQFFSAQGDHLNNCASVCAKGQQTRIVNYHERASGGIDLKALRCY